MVNSPDIKAKRMVLNMGDYVRLDEVQYLLVKKDLTMTENRDLKEDFESTELQYQIHERYLTSVKISMNTTVIREKGCLLYTSRCV